METFDLHTVPVILISACLCTITKVRLLPFAPYLNEKGAYAFMGICVYAHNMLMYAKLLTFNCICVEGSK